MSRAWSRRALATVFLLAMAAPVGAQSFAWWKSDQFQKEVGLTPEQCTRIDNVFQSTLPKLRQGRVNILHAHSQVMNSRAALLDKF